jgi:putative ATPase
MDLFEAHAQKQRAEFAPLADRMRPKTLAEFVGQEKLLGKGSPASPGLRGAGLLRRVLEQDRLPSIIFWGPPGTGKTTLARIIANETKSRFVSLSAVTSGLAELREVIKEAKEQQKFFQKRTIVFVDEIHRFNKAQQDAFLPHVEDGTIILIGATTENPSFEVNSALLSRCRVFVLEKLSTEEIEEIVRRALVVARSPANGGTTKQSSEQKIASLPSVARDDDKVVNVAKEVINLFAELADGDARSALNALELAIDSVPQDEKGTITLTKEIIKESFQKSHLLYDRAGEEHYNIISALHKSMRGSDADAALYWLGRMLEAGEDPLYIARRLVRFASEDVGLADPNALPQAVAAYQAAHFIGMPECNVILAQAVIYLARAPKSNALYRAYGEVRRTIQEEPASPVPLHLRNAPTKLMKELDYGKGYKYNPDFDGSVEQEYLPESLRGKKFFEL